MPKFRKPHPPSARPKPWSARLVNLGALRRNPDRPASVRTVANYRDCLLQIARRIAGDGLELRYLRPDTAVDYLRSRSADLGQKVLDIHRQALQNELRIQLDALRGERDGVAKALELERANRRRDRERHAALRPSLRNALKTVERVRESRDRYRELAARANAALLRTGPRSDLGSLKRRLRLALHKAGFALRPRGTPPGSTQRPARRNATPQVDPRPSRRPASVPPRLAAILRHAGDVSPPVAPPPGRFSAPCRARPPETHHLRVANRCSPFLCTFRYVHGAPPYQQRGTAARGGLSASPLLRLGSHRQRRYTASPRLQTGERPGRPWVTQRDAWIRSSPPADRNGRRQQRRGRPFHCTRNGTAARDRASVRTLPTPSARTKRVRRG